MCATFSGCRSWAQGGQHPPNAARMEELRVLSPLYGPTWGHWWVFYCSSLRLRCASPPKSSVALQTARVAAVDLTSGFCPENPSFQAAQGQDLEALMHPRSANTALSAYPTRGAQSPLVPSHRAGWVLASCTKGPSSLLCAPAPHAQPPLLQPPALCPCLHIPTLWLWGTGRRICAFD